ncbi:MAG: hypothetical protein IJQ06_07460 [Paludibacteraceae bacterium]|nr:hypothetical protein [Paludibacteraceae bacterium]
MPNYICTSGVIFLITALLLFSLNFTSGKHTSDYPLYILGGEIYVFTLSFCLFGWFDNVLPDSFSEWLLLIIGSTFMGVFAIGALWCICVSIIWAITAIGAICFVILESLFGLEITITKQESNYAKSKTRLAVISAINIASFIPIVIYLFFI